MGWQRYCSNVGMYTQVQHSPGEIIVYEKDNIPGIESTKRYNKISKFNQSIVERGSNNNSFACIPYSTAPVRNYLVSSEASVASVLPSIVNESSKQQNCCQHYFQYPIIWPQPHARHLPHNPSFPQGHRATYKIYKLIKAAGANNIFYTLQQTVYTTINESSNRKEPPSPLFPLPAVMRYGD